jgi:hypothetical protein
MKLEVATNASESISSFVKNYRTEIVEWTDYVNNNSKNILAISRKGPRLIEVLHEAGLINSYVLHNTFSEYALPFLEKMDELSIIDDSVLYGSTLNRMLYLSEQYLKIDKKKVDVVPIKYSVGTPDAIKSKINRNVSAPIATQKASHYINSLITSFKSLGKPYDIEHPIVYFQRDFNDIELLKIRIDNINNSISQYPLIVNDNDNSYPPSFTILLNSGESSDNNDFSRFRIYLNTDLTQLAIVPISPAIILNDDVENLNNTINPAFVDIWEKVYKAVNKTDEPECLGKHSLITFANYLNSLSLLLSYMPQFDEHFDQKEMFFNIYDLQILLGVKIANAIISELNDIITKGFEDKQIRQIPNFSGAIKNAILPSDYEAGYNEFLKNRIDTLKLLNEELEIINMIFIAQHYKIEIPSRTNNRFDDSDRLKFGVSLQYIIDKVKEIKPDYSIIKIHSALDKLIDCGTIVPQYRNVSTQEHQVIWKRVYRVGEGSSSTIQRIFTVGHLLKSFPNDCLQNGIPAVVLEKSLVIALTTLFHFDVLQQEECINSLGITRKFDLSGARAYFKNSDDSGHYLLDWLEYHNVLIRQPNSSYKINSIIFDKQNYWSEAEKELSITTTAKERLEDIAHFCYTVASEINENALVSITSLSTKQEYRQALFAELSLWLNHPKDNIYNCIHKLDELLSGIPNNDLLESCNTLLENNAKITDQVCENKTLFESFYDDMMEINKVVEASNNPLIKRVWTNIKNEIELKRKEQNQAYSNGDLLSVLQISRITTSICRALLSKAGYKYSKFETPETIKSYLENHLLPTIKDSPVRRDFEGRGVLDKLHAAVIDYDEGDDFSKTRYKLRGLLSNIILTCDNLCAYEAIATGSKQYFSKPLNPPVYVVMWDMRNSTSADNRSDIEQKVIFPINEIIKKKRKDSHNQFQVFEESLDDGNCFLTANFNDVISAFTTISRIANKNKVAFRMGCDVNYEGELHVYPSLKKNLFAGRAFEYAARTTSLYKEVLKDSKLWVKEEEESKFNHAEPSTSYLLVSEFVKRKATSDKQWNIDGIDMEELDGEYLPRVKTGTSIPYKIYQLTINVNQ